MRRIMVHQYAAFTNAPNKGNPAGVVLDAKGLSNQDMQQIALTAGFNETTFILKSEKADIQLRYFTPGHEMNLCGHGTIGALEALRSNGLLPNKREITIETKAGMLPIRVNHTNKEEITFAMRQAPPVFEPFNGSLVDLAFSIGLVEEDIETTLPIVYGSTGNWTLLVPIKHLHSFEKMVPNNQLFPKVLKEKPNTSVHPFCLETIDPKVHMHGRHFSSAYSGTIEDPVTGTASGVMGAYYATHIARQLKDGGEIKLWVEQGHEIGRNGRVGVHVKRNSTHYQVDIVGEAVYVNQRLIDF